MTDLLETVARATRLREGPSGVAAVLRAVYRAGPLRLQEAARQARLPLPVASAVRRELEKAGILERKQGLTLTESGRRFVEQTLGLGATHDPTCPACGGRGLVIPEDLRPAASQLEAIIACAPSVDVALDQAPCTAETSILRVLAMLKSGALEGRRVALLGDDDSLALAIGLVGRALGRADLARRVTSLDADPRRVAFLHAAAQSEGLAVEAIAHDLRDPLPSELRRNFDTVATDPPYTLAGAQLFLSRAAEALSGDGACFFSFAQWPPSEQLRLQQVILERGFAIRAVHPGFNRYTGASILGNSGQLIELVQAAAPAADLPTWLGPLYTAEVHPRARIYVCADCAAEIALGEDGAAATIEGLKAAGCPRCGETTFRRRSGSS